MCLRQNSRDVQTTLNILCIVSELLTVGECSFLSPFLCKIHEQFMP